MKKELKKWFKRNFMSRKERGFINNEIDLLNRSIKDYEDLLDFNRRLYSKAETIEEHEELAEMEKVVVHNLVGMQNRVLNLQRKLNGEF